MKRRIVESWLLLLYFDYLMRFRGFGRLHSVVCEQNAQPVAAQKDSCTDLCHSIDLACVFYFKRVLCLQRSAAAVILLRRHGWNAEMVIGAQLLPPEFHAWVEVSGCVANDKPYIAEIFPVLERF